MKRKINFSIISLVATICLLLLPLTLNALDAVLHSPDVLDVSQPGPNTRVKGTINIVWKMFDNDQNVIPYTATLYDPQTCNVTNYGKINQNPNGISSFTQNNVLGWNTRTTLTNSNIADGNYCLKICAALRNGNSPYSACNARNITIINNNRLPSITSVPSKLTFYENESWSYQIAANDPDGDQLTYRFVVKPAFLDINSQTGLITSNNINKNPGGNDTVKYSVTIAVDDNFSGSITQQFELTIKKVPTSSTPVTPPSNGGSTPTPPAPINHPTQITITSPLVNDIVDEDLLIKWNIQDEDGIKNVLLEYSTNSQTWVEITELDKPTTSQYLWDISELNDGDYYVRVTTTDNLNTKTSKTSGKFSVKIEDEEEEPVESSVLIINTSPVNNSEIDNRTPEISGEFVPSEGASIDTSSFKAELDDEDITNLCVMDEEGYLCRLNRELEVGRHKVKISVKDTNNQTAVSEWNFSILGEEAPASYPADVITIFGREFTTSSIIIGTVICIIVFLLIAIPWVLYILWNKRNKEKQLENGNVAENQENAIDSTYGYYLPPYNPVPVETVTAEVDPLEEYNKSLTQQFSHEPQQQMERAEPKVDFTVEEVEPVVPQQEDQSLAEEGTQFNPQAQQTPQEPEPQQPQPEQNIPTTPSTQETTPAVQNDVPSVQSPGENGTDEFVEPAPAD